MESVYIFGHKNPDSDSICSAIAYAHFKNEQDGDNSYIPARLGELNRETKFVLDTFAVSQPAFLPHVHVRVQDVMTGDVICAPETSTIHEIGEMMKSNNIRAVPIIDKNRRIQGVVTEQTLAQNYLRELDIQGLRDSATALGKITETLDGRLLVGDPETRVQGNVVIGAMAPEAMVEYIGPGDLVAVGNRENAQEAALGCNISCLIITGNFEPTAAIQELAKKTNAAIIVTPHDTFATARLINLSVSVLQRLDEAMFITSPETLVKEIAPDLVESNVPVALVNDGDGCLIGVLTKSDLVTRRRRRVILVDHSERSQSVEGVEQAEILEIVDHHRLGGLETAGPILAIIAPVGSTATLVLRRYRELGLEPPRQMAGLLTGAILSDTMLLKSPTTTAEDVAAIETLGQILDEDPLKFGQRMYNAKFDLSALTPQSILTNDFKKFALGSKMVGVGQVEVADKAAVLERKAELLEAMNNYQSENEFDLLLLMVSDILEEGTELLVTGHTRTVEKAFDVTVQENAVYLPGVLSRKKQVIPPLAGAV